MSDLISRSELINKIRGIVLGSQDVDFIVRLIENQPTAYSVDKVVEELEENHNGWIPCSERLPDSDKNRYIVQKTNGFIDILGFTKDAYKLSRYDFVEYKGKKKQLFYDYDSEYGYIEWECEAWQPLPDVYKGE